MKLEKKKLNLWKTLIYRLIYDRLVKIKIVKTKPKIYDPYYYEGNNYKITLHISMHLIKHFLKEKEEFIQKTLIIDYDIEKRQIINIHVDKRVLFGNIINNKKETYNACIVKITQKDQLGRDGISNSIVYNHWV